MKISTEIGSASKRIGEERAVEYYGKAGFDAFDLSLFGTYSYDWKRGVYGDIGHPFTGHDYLAFARRLKQIGLAYGMVCNQSHAPYPTCCPQIRSLFKRAIECTAEAGGGICIIHPDNNKGPQENAEMYFELLPFAKEHGVKIAAENMWNWDSQKGCSSFAACATSKSFLDHLHEVNDEYLVACLDIGHAEMAGSGEGAVKMIRALGPHLAALHLHDNDRLHDSHQIPFSMQVDFKEVIGALKAVDYRGALTLEADNYLDAYADKDLFEGMKKLKESAERLRKMYEEA